MAAAAARCAGHGGGGGGGGFLLRRRLLATAAFLAAFGLCTAAADDAATGRGQGHDHVMLSVEDMFPDSSSSSPSCDAPPRGLIRFARHGMAWPLLDRALSKSLSVMSESQCECEVCLLLLHLHISCIHSCMDRCFRLLSASVLLFLFLFLVWFGLVNLFAYSIDLSPVCFWTSGFSGFRAAFVVVLLCFEFIYTYIRDWK